MIVGCLLFLQRALRQAALAGLRTFGRDFASFFFLGWKYLPWHNVQFFKGLIGAFVMSQIRIAPLFVFIDVFANTNMCVRLCVWGGGGG